MSPAILGPEMAAPILWPPGIFGFFLLENPHDDKIPPFRGGGRGFLGRGGGSANFIFYGRGDFSDSSLLPKRTLTLNLSPLNHGPRALH